ncbi:MAG: hypothetical protein WCF14_10740 [Nitrososphaeraceae archaeon]
MDDIFYGNNITDILLPLSTVPDGICQFRPRSCQYLFVIIIMYVISTRGIDEHHVQSCEPSPIREPLQLGVQWFVNHI